MNWQSLLRSLGLLLRDLFSKRSEEITVPQLRQGILGISVPTGAQKAGQTELLGDGPSANLNVLADPPPRHRAFAASFVLQCIGVILLITVPMLLPKRLEPQRRYEVVSLVAPPTLVPLQAPKIPKVRTKVEEMERPKVAKLTAPPRRVFDEMKVEAPRPVHARAPVRTGALAAVSFAEPTTRKEAHQIQTGGFGDPNGLSGPGDPNKRANIARKGAYGLPNGAGFGNGLGGASGAPGIVAGSPGGGAPSEESVEILTKPRPVYTDEARRMRLEGDVVLQVIFRASGQVQVIRVVRGLGHGLDESAIRAAQQIHFKSARRHGVPVDFPAVIHIVFQMAY